MSNVSLLGLEGVLNFLSVQRIWSPKEACVPINILGNSLFLWGWTSWLWSLISTIQSDNTMAVAYINHQECTKSGATEREVNLIVTWAELLVLPWLPSTSQACKIARWTLVMKKVKLSRAQVVLWVRLSPFLTCLLHGPADIWCVSHPLSWTAFGSTMVMTEILYPVQFNRIIDLQTKLSLAENGRGKLKNVPAAFLFASVKSLEGAA